MRAPIACCVGSNGGAALSASYGSAEAVARRRALSVMLSTPRCTQWYTRPRGWSGLARAGAYGCVLPHHPTYTFSLNLHTQIFLSFHQLSFLSIDSFTLDFAYEYNHQRKMGWGTSGHQEATLPSTHSVIQAHASDEASTRRRRTRHIRHHRVEAARCCRNP